MLLELTADEFNKLPLGDAALMSIGWLSDGRDVAVQLRLSDDRKPTFTFEWVNELKVDLHQGERQPNQPFIWDGSATQIDDRKKVLLDFAGQGSLTLVCNSIRAEGT